MAQASSHIPCSQGRKSFHPGTALAGLLGNSWSPWQAQGFRTGRDRRVAVILILTMLMSGFLLLIDTHSPLMRHTLFSTPLHRGED